MHAIFFSGAGLLLALVLYKVVSFIITSRYHARQAAKLGCKPTFQRPYKLPFGVDMAWRLIKADQTNDVPNELMVIYEELQVPTWEQYLLGTPTFATVDPKNI